MYDDAEFQAQLRCCLITRHIYAAKTTQITSLFRLPDSTRHDFQTTTLMSQENVMIQQSFLHYMLNGF